MVKLEAFTMNLSAVKVKTIALLLLCCTWAWLPVFAQGLYPDCVQQCVQSHPKWTYPNCGRMAKWFLEGKACYEVFNDCAQSCQGPLVNPTPETYFPNPEQTQHRFRLEKVCSSRVQRIPLDKLPGSEPIHPEWQGRCECANGRLVKANCGHREASCEQVCNYENSFE